MANTYLVMYSWNSIFFILKFQVAVGDRDGVLQVFSCKKGAEISHAFKTLPGPEITRLELGGALGKCKILDVI